VLVDWDIQWNQAKVVYMVSAYTDVTREPKTMAEHLAPINKQ
jgi:hypothetical protein